VLFERICRENGITQRLTRPRSPTTTGKIERLHQTLQLELLNEHEPFTSIEQAQAAIDRWRQEYNADRPHQSLAMAFPAARFAPAVSEPLALRVPPDLASSPRPARPGSGQRPHPAAVAEPAPARSAAGAVELDRVVPPSGNVWVAGQQIWLGPAMTGRVIRIWAGTRQVHVLADGHRIKTLPSRLDGKDLARLAANGAVPAGSAPLPPPAGSVIEIERIVSASGNISIGNHVISAGSPLAGQRVTVRLEGPVAHTLANGTVVRTVACPVAQSVRQRLRGARAATAGPPRLPDPLTVRRRVSVRGAIMIGGQRIQVGLPHAGKTAQVTVETDTYQITVEDGIALAAPRRTSRDIKRHKASNHQPG
jgi:Integrase core domain